MSRNIKPGPKAQFSPKPKNQNKKPAKAKGNALSSATIKPDELSEAVSIRAKIDASGLDLHGKSRALAALDRLLGGVIGWPGAWFEGKRARSEVIQKMRMDKLIADGLPEMAAQRLVAEEIRKQDNLQAVWQETEQILLAAPPPEVSPTPTEPEKLDDDWMNFFSNYAEKASSDRLRAL